MALPGVRVVWRVAIAAVFAGVGCGCEREQPSSRPAPPADVPRVGAGPVSRDPVVPPSQSSTPALLPPLGSETDLVELRVSEAGSGIVSVPRNSLRPRPLVVVIHGEPSSSEQQCASWRRIVGPNLFVLCLRAATLAELSKAHLYYFEVDRREDGVRRALVALKAKYGAYLAPGPVVLVGTKEGAPVAAAIARQEPSFFSRLVLVHGGYERWSPTYGATYAARGGRRLLLVWDPSRPPSEVERAVQLARHSRIEARSMALDLSGGTFEGRSVEQLAPEFRWLVGGDSRFLEQESG
ncbi:MAG: hypothetical protein JW751_07720 [Polyangiaceae bacterium]|nr:hypothetical protein [Polyangiaceae bacterium]